MYNYVAISTKIQSLKINLVLVNLAVVLQKFLLQIHTLGRVLLTSTNVSNFECFQPNVNDSSKIKILYM